MNSKLCPNRWQAAEAEFDRDGSASRQASLGFVVPIPKGHYSVSAWQAAPRIGHYVH